MSPQKEEQLYDNVQIKNIIDSTIIEGHDAVKMHLEHEKKMLAEHGTSIIFQVYRLNLQADSLGELQGEKLAEIKVDSSFVSMADTVAMVKGKVQSLLKEKAGIRNRGQRPEALTIETADRITFFLSGCPLLDDTSFYSDNHIILPVWIQVLLHPCESGEVVQLISKLQKQP